MRNKKGFGFLGWAVTFFIISIVAAVFGFGLISGVSFTIAKWLAIIFVFLFIVSIVMYFAKRV